MGLISSIIVSEVNRAHREKVKRNRAAADRAVRAVMARTPYRPLYPTPAPTKGTGR